LTSRQESNDQAPPVEETTGLFAGFLERFRAKSEVDLIQRARQSPAEFLKQVEFVDHAWYRQKYSEASSSSLTPEQHYVSQGAPQGFDPNPLFRSTWYLDRYPNVKAMGLNPAIHYVLIGSRSGLRPNPLFDPVWYRKTYSDVAASGLEPLVHYLKFGAREHRNPAENVFTPWLPRRRDRTGTGELNPLVVYLDLIEAMRLSTTKPSR